MHDKLAAGIWYAGRKRPYFNSLIQGLLYVEIDAGDGFMASVDTHGLVYVNRAWLSQPDVTQANVAGVVVHEAMHVLLRHAPRQAALNAQREPFNVAADVEINQHLGDDLAYERLIYPPDFGWPPNLTAEEYYELAMAELQRRCVRQQPQKSSPDGDGSAGPGQAPSSGPDADEGEEGDAGQEAGAGGEDGDEEGGEEGAGAAEPEPPEADGAEPPTGEAGESGNEEPDQSGAGGSGGSGQGEQGEEIDGEEPAGADGQAEEEIDEGAGTTGSQPPDQAMQDAMDEMFGAYQGDGSGAGGVPLEHELGELPEDDEPGLSEGEVDAMRRSVALAIAQSDRGKGTQAGYWERWAKDLLNPTVPWQRVLQLVHQAIQQSRTAKSDYSFRRPAGATSPGDPPGVVGYDPQVAVVVDTSGSMSDADLGMALGELEGILRALDRANAVKVLVVDAAVQHIYSLRSARGLQLKGGGGTDMGLGIDAAAGLKPRPDVVIVLTDGWTDWPARPPARVSVVACLTQEQASRYVPSWIKTVVMRHGG